MNGKLYVTTPIYYVNDIPHIGHAYTTVAADILARYNRLCGRDVFFLTGTDEHGQKVEEAAGNRRISPKKHADLMVLNFSKLWKKLLITNDAFIRTTDEAHIRTVQGILQMLWDRGEIEKRPWRGWYCTPDERFWTETDLIDGNCPDCGRTVELIEEENYFFLMSKYQDRLMEHIQTNPEYILPEFRKNEVMGFLKSQPLGDLCISRPRLRLSWGVPIPFDENFVTYVWFDALLNYFSATRYLAPKSSNAGHTGEEFLSQTYYNGEGEFWWPPDYHIVGKDILTTHAVYWSTMLMALNLPLPKSLFAHGWWTVDGKKMSKSMGNVVDPNEMVEKFGADALRYFLLREVPFGLDGDFSINALAGRINSDLANDLGNLASRALNMIVRYRDGIVPAPGPEGERESELRAAAEAVAGLIGNELKKLRFNKALEEIWKLISLTNKYIEDTAPWKLAKSSADKESLNTVLYSVAESLRLLCVNLAPFLPESMQNLWARLGQEIKLDKINLNEERKWGLLRPGTVVIKGESLFPRVDMKINNLNNVNSLNSSNVLKENETSDEKLTYVQSPESDCKADNLITITDFARVELKTGKVLAAESIKKSNKLLCLQVDTGGQARQIVAGIAKSYTPEELVGKTVIVVTNLAPAKLFGVESQGMLLAASGNGNGLALLTTDQTVAPGAKVG